MASTGSGSVSVQLLKTPDESQNGLVRVTVPKDEASFTFAVPKDVYAGESPAAVRASSMTLENGSPLPSWLSLDPATMSIVAINAPASSLPIRIVLTIAGKRTVVVVSAATDAGK